MRAIGRPRVHPLAVARGHAGIVARFRQSLPRAATDGGAMLAPTLRQERVKFSGGLVERMHIAIDEAEEALIDSLGLAIHHRHVHVGISVFYSSRWVSSNADKSPGHYPRGSCSGHSPADQVGSPRFPRSASADSRSKTAASRRSRSRPGLPAPGFA